MPTPIIHFDIHIWQTTESDLCQPGDQPGWRWKVTIWQEGWPSRRLYKEGCEDRLHESSYLAQDAVRTYGKEN